MKKYSGIDERADRNMDVITDIYRKAALGRVSVVSKAMLHRRLDLSGFKYVDGMDIKYEKENRLFAQSYNINYIVEYSVDTKAKSKDEIKEGLKNPLIQDRINALDIADFKLDFNEKRRVWKASFTTLIGSTTWLLIPPAMNIIKPTTLECAQTIELLQLIGDLVN